MDNWNLNTECASCFDNARFVSPTYVRDFTVGINNEHFGVFYYLSITVFRDGVGINTTPQKYDIIFMGCDIIILISFFCVYLIKK